MLHGRIVWVHFDNKQNPPCCDFGISFERLRDSDLAALERSIDMISRTMVNLMEPAVMLRPHPIQAAHPAQAAHPGQAAQPGAAAGQYGSAAAHPLQPPAAPGAGAKGVGWPGASSAPQASETQERSRPLDYLQKEIGAQKSGIPERHRQSSLNAQFLKMAKELHTPSSPQPNSRRYTRTQVQVDATVLIVFPEETFSTFPFMEKPWT